MKIAHGSIVALAVALAVSLVGGAAIGVVAAAAPQSAPQGSTLDPEHQLLAKWVGTWDATVEMPGMPEATSKAKATARLTAGGLWLVTDYEGTADGGPFSGHEVKGFDPRTKKYVINWVDSMTPMFDLGDGDFDAKTKTLTATMKSVNLDGTPKVWRQTDVWKDADTHEWTMLQPGPDGKEMAVLKITYKRKK